MSPITLPPLVDADLRLRPPTEADVPVIAAICRDPDIQRFTRVPAPYTEDDARWFVRFSEQGLANGTGIHLLAVDHEDRVRGAVGLSVDPVDFSGELGYWIAPASRRQGVAVRGSRLLLRVAFDHLDLGYVGLHAAATNPGSNAVARRLGFTLEGTQRRAMVDGPSGDRTAPRCDANVWGLLPHELVP